MRLEHLESRNLFAALPLGVTPQDTGEFMLGRVAVVPVLFESTGRVNTENWTPQLIDAALDKVREGVNWWSEALDRLNTVHSLEFVIDESFARSPFPTAFEPIALTSQEAPLYITPFLRAQGIEDAPSMEDAVQQFNHAARERLETDWAFTIFIVNSSNDADGGFAPGSEFNIAFAYPGGLYVVTPSTRPASTISHEMGHIFWARDEYPGGGSWTDRRGYYNAQNLNASDNPTPGFVQEPSIMRAGTGLTTAYNTFAIPESTRAMIGWRDSDGDGIFDLADVPLHFEGTGRYEPQQGVFTFAGNARAVPLPNRNSSGTQNDITLNRVDRIEYRVDGGPWLTAHVVDAQVATFEFDLTIDPFDTIELRAIDDRVGVTSPILQTAGLAPLASGSVRGFAFVDSSGEGENGAAEAFLPKVTARITKMDGSELLRGFVDPDLFSGGPIEPLADGVTLSASGVTLDGRVGAFADSPPGNNATFHYYNLQNARWQNAWSTARRLVVDFPETIGNVSFDVSGLTNSGSFARLEAYDSNGIMLSRVTSARLAPGETAELKIEDARGRIARVVAYGHQFSSVSLDNLRYGSPAEVVTAEDGVFRFAGIPDGSYRLMLTPERLIHRYSSDQVTIVVSNGSSAPLAAAFERVASPWRNPSDRFDVDGNGSVQPLDALRIINEISRNGARILTNASSITQFFDASDDGAVTALDALRVINELSRRGRAGGEGMAEAESDVPIANQTEIANRLSTDTRVAQESPAESRFAPAAADQTNFSRATDAVFAGWGLDEKRRNLKKLTADLTLSLEPNG
jgi:hypothetical protein